jgi:phosphatidylinositol dimannoside acyltransferase
VSGRLSALGYAAGWGLVRRLPEPVVTKGFNIAADHVVRRNGRGVQRLRSNLAVVCPELSGSELDELVRQGMRSYLRYWREAFRMPDWDPERIVGSVRLVNEEILRDSYAEGHGVVSALAHLGNYDHAGAWAGLTGMPVTAVAERLEPESVFDRFVAYRNKLGMTIVPLTGGGEDVFGVLADRLRAGHYVCLLADRDLSDRGVPVTFFGRQSRMPAGPALLSLRTKAPLVPVTAHYDGPALVLTIHPVVSTDGGAAAMTQRVADVFAEAIAAHPQDWHMLQRIFLD